MNNNICWSGFRACIGLNVGGRASRVAEASRGWRRREIEKEQEENKVVGRLMQRVCLEVRCEVVHAKGWDGCR